METGEVGTVQELWRFPVKSMQGERLDGVAVSAAGLLGDGAYAIVDRESGKVASAKHPKLWPQLLDCRANFTRPPQLGEDLPPVQIELADGTSVTRVGHTAAVGDELRLIVAVPNGRCVMKTAAQPGLPHDSAILRGLAQHNRLDVPGRGLYPCAGVYAMTESGGTIRTGDAVRVL